MTAVTRRALRVCTALTELRGRGTDVLDALIPFFDPMLELMNGKIFDPRLFAIGVQKLYKWRFTSDIAEQFIPRLERAGFLERVVSGREPIFLVRYSTDGPNVQQPELSRILSDIIDEFEKFPPRVTDLLAYNKTRDELADVLIRFLVSLDAYAPAEFAEEIRRLKLGNEVESSLSTLEEGGRPLPHEDKYMAARFVQYLCTSAPQYVPELARLASVGLLTEVVEDFLKPIQPNSNVELSIIVDAPLALDYLGCSGTALRNDVACIFDSLRQIGCKIVALPVTCTEIQRNLESMLAKPPPARHGYTHNALVRNEVMLEFVQAVANDPERALNKAGITVPPLSLEQLPNQHRFFSQELYEDFFASIIWVADVAPREHDATCLALTMRLRAGHQRNDLFRCKYVFVTRNPRFVRDARKYCLDSRLIKDNQESPVIHQRELATIAWLRTGLGASESVPQTHLLATCDRVLNLRKEVRDTVGQKLRALTPDRIEQYELLLLDQKSIRRLADLTLNDEKVITDENAEQLLEAMRRATAEDERLLYEEKLKASTAKSKEKLQIERQITAMAKRDADRMEKERALLQEQLIEMRRSRLAAVREIAGETERFVRRVDVITTALVFIVAMISASNYVFGWLTNYRMPSALFAGALALFGAYHMIMNALERPKIGVLTIINWLARKDFIARLKRARLLEEIRVDRIHVEHGRIIVDNAIPLDYAGSALPQLNHQTVPDRTTS